MIKFDSKGIHEIRRDGDTIKLIYNTDKTASDSFGEFEKEMLEICEELSEIF